MKHYASTYETHNHLCFVLPTMATYAFTFLPTYLPMFFTWPNTCLTTYSPPPHLPTYLASTLTFLPTYVLQSWLPT
jgi:hypothetical protein